MRISLEVFFFILLKLNFYLTFFFFCFNKDDRSDPSLILPKRVFFYMMSFVDYGTIRNGMNVNKKWNSLLEEEEVIFFYFIFLFSIFYFLFFYFFIFFIFSGLEVQTSTIFPLGQI